MERTMRKRTVRVLLGVVLALATLCAPGLAGSVTLFADDFEGHAVGTLPIGPAETWCMVDRFGNASTIPVVEDEGGSHGRVLRIDSPGASARLNVGRTFAIPARQPGESLTLEFDIRLNDARTNWFAELVDRYYTPSGGFGCVTQEPRAPVWQLMGAHYKAGTVGDPLYPFNGIAVSTMDSADPQNPNGPREHEDYDIELEVGRWYTVRVEHFGFRIDLSLDGVKVQELQSPYYELDSSHDWMLNIGDGDSHGSATCDISIDNVRVVRKAEPLQMYVVLFEPETGACGSAWINGVTWAGDAVFNYVNRLSWDWGDGTSNDSWFPAAHRYRQNGTYTVAVTAWGPYGNSVTEMADVTITNALDPACSCGPNVTVDAPIPVLHVSIIQEGEVERVIDIAGAGNLFDVTEISLGSFNSGVPANLSDYEVVVFGINDGYEADIPWLATPFSLPRLTTLRSYVESGGGVVWTHDSLEWGQDLGADVEVPAGVDYQVDADRSGGVAIELVEEHPIARQPFDLKAAGDWFVSEWTHTTGGVLTTALPVVRFAFADPSDHNFYLSAKESGDGRVVVSELGHSIWQFVYGGTTWPDDLEAKLFVNGLFWAANVVPPDAGFSYAPDCVLTDEAVDFTDMSTDDGAIGSWTWDFGDGTSSGDQHPSHAFSSPGTYTVVLAVTDNQGLTGTASHDVRVHVRGDLDGDGDLDVADVLILYRYVNGLHPLDPCQEKRADIDLDSDVDEDDARALAEVVFGL